MNVKHYVQDELSVVQSWINERGFDATAERNNTVDKTAADIVLTYGHKDYLIEVKIEDNWPFKTGNVTLDIISAFRWKTQPVRSCNLDELISRISVLKWGSLYDDRYNILLKQIRNTYTGEFINIALSAKKLRAAIPYFENTYPVMVNPKRNYGLNDTWESAFMCVDHRDPYFIAALI